MLEKLSQNRKDLQTQVPRIKETIEKIIEKGTSLAERICNLICEQGSKIILIVTGISMIFSINVLTISDVFEEKESLLSLHQKIKRP